MSWKPNEKQIEYMKIIQCMTLDTIFGRGVENEKTYIENMKVIIELISQQGIQADAQG